MLLYTLAMFPLAQVSLLTFLVVSVLLSGLVFHYLYAVVLLKRHAYLSMLAQPQSPWRTRLWQSVVATAVTAVASVFLAAAIWIAAAQLSVQEWGIFGLSVLTFGLLKYALQGWVARHVTPAYQHLTLLRLSHWLNVVVICGLLLAAHYWWLEVPDTRGMALMDAMRQAYDDRVQANALQLPGTLLGINAAIYTGFWHVTQVLSSSAPWWMTMLFWATLVLALALQASIIWLPLLGLQRLLTPSSQTVVATRRPLMIWTLVVAVVVFASWRVETESTFGAAFETALAPFSTSSSAPSDESHAEPCNDTRMSQIQQQTERQTTALRNTHQQRVREDIHRRIEQQVASAFASSEAAIDGFLDWNFSLVGQYAQLAMLAQSRFSDHSFDDRLGQQLDQFFQHELGPALAMAEAQLATDIRAHMTAGGERFNQQVEGLVNQHTMQCWEFDGVTIDVNEVMRKSAVGAGVVPGVALMSRALAPGSALLARTGARRAIAMMSGRMAARAGTSAGAATAGSVCGPMCMLVAGAATWIGTDLVINYADESINRAAMRAYLMDAVEAQQQHLTELVKEDVDQWLALVFDDLEEQHNARFNLSRERQAH